MTERWTDESLDRFASTVTSAIAASNDRLAQTEQIVASNARAIAANSEAIAASRESMAELKEVSLAISRDVAQLVATQQAAEQERAELRQATLGIANLLSSLDSDRPTILRKLNAIENKVDRILEREDRDLS